MNFKYKLAILGGTFDRFHIGHQYLIATAFKQSENVIIGLSTSELIKQKFLSETIETYTLRENYLKEYLKRKGLSARSEIVPIADIFGNSLKRKNIQAVFVTNNTYKNACVINMHRRKTGLDPLKIVTVPFLKGADGKIITSEKIRFGEIDRFGNPYMKVFNKRKKLIMSDNLRMELRKPQGFVLTNYSEIKNTFADNIDFNTPVVIAVGDIVAKILIELNHQPDISLIDFKTRRKPIEKKDIPVIFTKNISFKINNHPGSITKNAVNVFRESLKRYLETKNKQIIAISGEEDLLTLPVILLAPLHSLVFYGQHDLGTIIVRVTEDKKKQIKDLLEKFE